MHRYNVNKILSSKIFIALAITGLVVAFSSLISILAEDGTVQPYTSSIEGDIFERPLGLAVDSLHDRMYVLNTESFVTVVDLESRLPLEKIIVSGSPESIGLNSNTQKLYLVDTGENVVVMIDVRKGVTKVIPVGLHPRTIYINTTDNKIYVLNYDGNSISVIDGFSDEVMTAIPVGQNPNSIDVLQSLNIVYVTSVVDSELTIIDGENNEIAAVVQLEIEPSFVFVEKSGSSLFIASRERKAIVEMDVQTGEIKRTFNTIGTPLSASLSNYGQSLFVANNLRDVNNLVVINVRDNVSQTINVEGAISRVRSFADKIYILNDAYPRIEIFAVNSYELLKTIPLPDLYRDFFFDRTLGEMYILSRLDKISILDLNTDEIVATISEETEFVPNRE